MMLLQVPAPQLQQLLRQTFLRFICLMGGTAGNREWTTVPVDVGAVLAYKYGSVLLEMLGGVVAAADGLHDEFVVEVQHIMGVPQVWLCRMMYDDGLWLYMLEHVIGLCRAIFELWCLCSPSHSALSSCSHAECTYAPTLLLLLLQVQAQLAAAAAGCHAGVLCRNNRALLNEVLTAVGAAVPWSRQPVQSDGLSVSTLGHTYSAMKVQN